jgi:hypothetical protein
VPSDTLFDPRSYELAAYFLEGSAADTKENRIRLAQCIQLAVESELGEIELAARINERGIR